MSLRQLYLRLLLIAAVALPFYWLVFTDDGQRRTDRVLLSLSGAPEVNLDLAALDPMVNEARVRAEFPELPLQCRDGATPYGDRLCHAEIAAFNGIPARYLSFFFAGEGLGAVKLAYRRAYHGALLEALTQRLGPPLEGGGQHPAAAPSVPPSDPMVRLFRAGGGLAVMPATAEAEPALFWIVPPAAE